MKKLSIQVLACIVLTGGVVFCTTRNFTATTSNLNQDPQNLKDVFDDIRWAWLKADVSRITHYIGDAKVIISFENEGLESGLYSRNQAHYLLADLFKKAKTTSFAYSKIIEEKEKSDHPHAFADRTYTRYIDGSHRSEQIYVSLSKMNNRWIITHIMSLEKPKGRQSNNDSQ